jgi:hypothetical protein
VWKKAVTSNNCWGGEENFQIMTDEEIINNVLEDNTENKQESSTPPNIPTIRHGDAVSAFNTCYKWAEEK